MATGCGEGRDEKERVSTKKSERAVNCQRVARARAFRGKPTPPGYQEPGGEGGVPPVGTGVCVGGLCRRACIGMDASTLHAQLVLLALPAVVR